MGDFDPNSAGVKETLDKLEKADDAERQRILQAEQAGKGRKSVLEPYGIDPNARVDATGRTLYPWEVSPEDSVVMVEPDESEEAQAAREAQQERDELVAAASASQGGDQGGSTEAGVGVADAGLADAGAGAGDTTV